MKKTQAMKETLVGLVTTGVIVLGVVGAFGLRAIDERANFGSEVGWGRGQSVAQVYQTAPSPTGYERTFTLISPAIPVDGACLERILSADGGQVPNVRLRIVAGKVDGFSYDWAKEGGGLTEVRGYLRRLAAECKP